MRFFTGLLVLLFSAQLAGTTVVDMSLDDPLLVVDGLPGNVSPRNFRHTWTELDEGLYDLTGFHELGLIGSGAPDERHLRSLMRAGMYDPVVVIDLRKESHAYINGHSVSLYGLHNWTNRDVGAEEVDKREELLVDGLSDQETVSVGQIVSKVDHGVQVEAVFHELQVESVLTEEELVRSAGYEYHRVYITDHHGPTAEEMDRFLEIIRSIPEGTVIYFHCRAGKGRTTLMMVAYDILMNAGTVSLENIKRRHLALGGSNLLSLPSEDSYKYEASVYKQWFLEALYQYALSDHGGFKVSWSDWLRQYDDRMEIEP